MTENEAIHCLKVYIDETVCEECELHSECTHETQADVARLAIAALKKQIPKKPILDTIYHQQYHCPNCEDELCKKYEYDKRYANCQWCGQAIDWEE